MEADNIGARIRHFRRMKGFSQLQLEVAIGASPGSISRMENGVINPTKETLLKIAEILKLSSQHTSYILGVISQPTNTEEVKEVKEKLKLYLQDPDFIGYIADDRWRMIDISQGFATLLSLNELDFKKIKLRVENHTILELLLVEELGICQFLDPNYLPELIYLQTLEYFHEVGSYMTNDIYFSSTMRAINQHPIASKVWSNLLNSNTKNYATIDRSVKFKLKSAHTLQYNRQTLYHINPRFEIIEYTTIHKN